MAQKRSVGVVLYVEENGIRYAVLTRRGPGTKPDGSPESWIGLHQVSAHGGLEGLETWQDARLREMEEELGMPFIQHGNWDFKFELINKVEGAEKEVQTYKLRVSLAALACISLEWPTIGIRLVGPEQTKNIKTIKEVGAQKDVPITGPEVVMFADEAEAVRKVVNATTYLEEHSDELV